MQLYEALVTGSWNTSIKVKAYFRLLSHQWQHQSKDIDLEHNLYLSVLVFWLSSQWLLCFQFSMRRMLVTPMFSDVATISRTFSSFLCSVNEQIYRSWEGA